MGHKPTVHSLLSRGQANGDAVRSGVGSGVESTRDGELVDVSLASGTESLREVHGWVVVAVDVGVLVCACRQVTRVSCVTGQIDRL